MCRAADAAMAMVNRSIELARETGNEAYYMDFVKLHKLLYLAQCSMLAQYDQRMFDEKITARECGPYVDGISFVPRERGFDKIRMPFNSQDFVRPSYWRMKIIEQILGQYGTLDREKVIQITRDTPACRMAAQGARGQEWPEISRKLMYQNQNQGQNAS